MLSIFLGVFARIVKVTHFTQVINFRDKSHGKIHLREVDKNNRESTFLSFFFFATQQQKQEVYSSFFFVAFILASVELLDITVHEVN